MRWRKKYPPGSTMSCRFAPLAVVKDDGALPASLLVMVEFAEVGDDMLARLQEAVNTQHVHPRLGGQTPAQHRRGLRLRKLPASFVVPTGRQELAVGRVTFIRRVSPAGTVSVLSQSYRVGKRHRGLYLQLVVDTGRGRLTAYLNGRVLKRWPYKLLND